MPRVANAPKRAGRLKKGAGTKERMLEAAVKLFAAKGFDGVSVREIADLACLGLPTMYHYYGDKAALYSTVVLTQQEKLRKRNEDALNSIESYDDLREWITGLIRNAVDHTDFSKLMFRELLAEKDDLIKRMSENAFQPLFDHLQERLNAIRPGSGDGVLPIFIFAVSSGLLALGPFRKHLKSKPDGSSAHDFSEVEIAQIVEMIMIVSLFADIFNSTSTHPQAITNRIRQQMDETRPAVRSSAKSKRQP